MIVQMQDTTTSKISKKLVTMRSAGGSSALSRVLTLLVITGAGYEEDAIAAASLASREHPCRIVVVVQGAADGRTRLDAQIRLGGDAGAAEVIVLHIFGPDAHVDESLVSGLLLPDAPIVAWWPHGVPRDPANTPLGRIAHRRITDSGAEADPRAALFSLAESYRAGDTDLAWTRLTLWRAQLASVFDQLDPAQVTSATVTGAVDSPSTVLLAAWLALTLEVSIKTVTNPAGTGIASVVLQLGSGDVQLVRSGASVAELILPNQPTRLISLPRRDLKDCLTEELRRFDADGVFGDTLLLL